MTDITELAPAMKAAAIDAKELAIIARYSKGRAAAEKFYALANPNNVLALVEALEKAQAEISSANRVMAAQDSELTTRRQRIADLESRTVTVKLPQRLQPGADGFDDWYLHSDDDGEYLRVDDVIEMLTASGIQIQGGE